MYHPTDTATIATANPSAGGPVGRCFDPYAFAEAEGIRVVRDSRAPRMGLWEPEHRTIRLRRGCTAAHDRATLTLNLGFAIAETPDVEGVWKWTGERIMPDSELHALASVTSDRMTWARALLVSPVILTVYLLIKNASEVI